VATEVASPGSAEALRTPEGSAEVIARCNGSVLVQDGDTVGIVERGGGWYGTALFVLALIGLFTSIAGVLVLSTTSIPAGIGVLGVAALDIAVVVWLFKRKRAAGSAPLPAPWLVLDRAAGVVRDGSGAKLCSFGELKIERVFQAGSSSKALAVYCPRKLVVARGTPFGDEVDSFEAALRRATSG
jgi:hypothetical protein